MLDQVAFALVWLASLVLMIYLLTHGNNLPRANSLGCHVRKVLSLAVLAGAICNVISPVYGFDWSVYGSHIITVAVGLRLAVALMCRWAEWCGDFFDDALDVFDES